VSLQSLLDITQVRSRPSLGTAAFRPPPQDEDHFSAEPWTLMVGTRKAPSRTMRPKL
jgi:hypothetical protein